MNPREELAAAFRKQLTPYRAADMLRQTIALAEEQGDTTTAEACRRRLAWVEQLKEQAQND